MRGDETAARTRLLLISLALPLLVGLLDTPSGSWAAACPPDETPTVERLSLGPEDEPTDLAEIPVPPVLQAAKLACPLLNSRVM